MKKVCFLILVSATLMCSCGKEKKAKKEDTSYRFFNLQNAGWKSKSRSQYIGDITYRATEVPLQYYIYKSVGDDLDKVDSIYNALSDERVIEVEFEHANEEDLLGKEFTRRGYKESVEYMSFKIEKDFMVVTSSNDTIPCAGVTFERNFKVAPFKRVLLHFNKVKPEDQIQLVYQDKLFGNGTLKFKFNEIPIKL